jgi:hypothetical protein
MSDFDLDQHRRRLEASPDPAEMEKLQRTAAAVSRRARLGQIVTSAPRSRSPASSSSSSSAIPAQHLRPRRATILILLFSVFRQRQLAPPSCGLTGSTEEMLDQSIERARHPQAQLFGTISMVGPGDRLLLRLRRLPAGGNQRFATMIANSGSGRFIPGGDRRHLAGDPGLADRSIRVSDASSSGCGRCATPLPARTDQPGRMTDRLPIRCGCWVISKV